MKITTIQSNPISFKSGYPTCPNDSRWCVPRNHHEPSFTGFYRRGMVPTGGKTGGSILKWFEKKKLDYFA